jgi:hypothetical protein
MKVAGNTEWVRDIRTGGAGDKFPLNSDGESFSNGF